MKHKIITYVGLIIAVLFVGILLFNPFHLDDAIEDNIPLGARTTSIDTKFYTHIATLTFEYPTTSDDGLFQHKFSSAVTITRISASTDTGIVYFQLDERTEATPNSAGTDVLSSSLAADSNSEASTSFSNAGIAGDAVLSLDVDTVSGSPTIVRIHIDYQFDD